MCLKFKVWMSDDCLSEIVDSKTYVMMVGPRMPLTADTPNCYTRVQPTLVVPRKNDVFVLFFFIIIVLFVLYVVF